MKKIIKKFSVLLTFILFLQPSLQAQEDHDDRDDHDNDKQKKYEFVKKKAVNKSYNVSSSDKLNIQNSFGSVDVYTWDKNEIKVDVNVEVSANTDALAQRILDRISISNDQRGKEISFQTNMKDINNTKDDKSTMSINYTISMPASNPLEIKNEFGSTTIPDYKGEVELTSKFGKLNTGNLSNVKSIQVEFGKANLGNIPGGTITIKYSKASIAKLSGAIKMNVEFSSKVVLNLDNNLTSLYLNTSYSSINLRPIGDLPASYAISTSFGSFKNRTSAKFTDDEEDGDHGPKFDHEYTGKSGGGSIPVKVKSSFSTIVLGEASAEDMKDK
ncbi:MAG: hypothetical protein ABIO04_14160, partial [Ferruginibacter sp.]